jgi:hypothetical protein
MPNLRLVTSEPANRRPLLGSSGTEDLRPRVSLRLLMAASGRCSCDDCLLAYRAGDNTAGIIQVGAPTRRLAAVR